MAVLVDKRTDVDNQSVATRLDIFANGDVRTRWSFDDEESPKSGWVSLSGVTFFAEQ
jgi:hypothetical protein